MCEPWVRARLLLWHGMTVLLVSNDDGVDSPALRPLLRRLRDLSEVSHLHAVVPDRERSWISKAITRFDEISVEKHEGSHNDPEILAASGFPADCANLGIHTLFPLRPDLLVSGINVGCNHGLAFLLGSGTVGAASEAFIAGIPAVAFSIGNPGNHANFVEYACSDEGAEVWDRAAAVAGEIVSALIVDGFPAGVDLLNVNFPSSVTLDSTRIVTEIAPMGYDELFARQDSGNYRHRYPGSVLRTDVRDGITDLESLEKDCVSITPVRLARAAPLDEATRRRLER